MSLRPPKLHRSWTLVLLALILAVAAAPEARAQDTSFRLVGPDGQEERLPVVEHRGYAAVSTAALERSGWRVEAGSGTVRARLGREEVLELRPGNPFFTWSGEVFQLVRAPYFFGEHLYVPLQLLTGFLPRHLEEDYAEGARARSLTVRRAALWTPDAETRGSRLSSPEGGPAPGAEEETEVVVVIDPGHGGKDTGALGLAGVVEKDVVLGVAHVLARELEDDPGIEVHLTRSDDTFVPLWERGEKATGWKGERPGVFISLHTNAASRSSSVRGFETYFLSEARTEHERRVAALENAPLDQDAADGRGGEDGPDLSFILNDLRNQDHQHWSALLAELVQDELAPVHPGPNRGVKQGPFAVITNALMPGVLVELGFITNGSEARLLGQERFQKDAGRSLARAIRTFFRRYPPGADVTAGGSR